MLSYLILYRREPVFHENSLLNSNAWLSEKKEYIQSNYVPLAVHKANDLNEVYHYFQGEVWSPEGEATPLIRALGLTHTSMSVGDLIFDVEDGSLYEVSSNGFSVVCNCKFADLVSNRF